MKKKFLAIAGVGAASIALIVGAATPAQALAWPSGGYFEIPGTMAGGASWQIGSYGIHHAGDTADNVTHWLYYPLENFGSDYFYCGTGNGSDATLTQEVNGDVTIDCQPVTDNQAVGLTTTLHIRLYVEASTGYMARVWAEVENTTGAAITLAPEDALGVYYYYNYNAWANGDPWMTNVGGGDYGLDGSVWGAGGDVNDNEIATSAVWGDLSQSCDIKAGANRMFYPESANTIAAGDTVNLISFINMVFPTTNDATGTTAAYQAALAHAQGELSQGLTGRLAAGLPAGIVAAGWGTDDHCNPAPELPNTGVDAGSLGVTGLAALGLLVAGCAALVVRRRTN